MAPNFTALPVLIEGQQAYGHEAKDLIFRICLALRFQGGHHEPARWQGPWKRWAAGSLRTGWSMPALEWRQGGRRRLKDLSIGLQAAGVLSSQGE